MLAAADELGFIPKVQAVSLKRTMAGALGAFQGQWGTDIPLLILALTLAVFLVFQRRFVSAMLQGSIKG